MQLKERGGIYYAVGKISGTLYRVSTQFRVGGRDAQTAARRRMAEIEVEIRGGQHGWVKYSPTVSEWWDTYKATTMKRKSPSTQRRDTGTMVREFLPLFGSTKLSGIKKSDCLKYLEDRRGMLRANPGHKSPVQISEGTVQRERRFLQAFFEEAIENGHIDKNPWRGIERIADQVRERLLGEDEQRELLTRLSPRFQRFVLFLLGTGVRIEECRGINPKTDINWQQRLVKVTGKGSKTRLVPLTSAVVQVLKDQLAEDGKLWQQNQQRFRAVLTKACAAREGREEIPHLSPHVLRHTFGWRYLRGGGDIYSLSKILGHASVVVTEKHYAQLLKEDLVAKIDRVDFGLVSAEIPPPAPDQGSLQPPHSVIPFAVHGGQRRSKAGM